jgi:hypothetical protein
VPAGPVDESAFGTVLHLCERFYEVVLLDLGAGLTNPFARVSPRGGRARVGSAPPRQWCSTA